MTILKSFEKPLTPEEELKYLTKFKEEQDEHAKEVLIERNMRLVAHIAKKYNNSSEDQDDLISIGTIGLIKAIETYNIEKGTRLATYASKCIENEILMYIRKISGQKAEVSLDEPINTDWDGNELLLSDILGTDEDIVSRDIENEAEREMLLAAVSELGEREQEIMQMRFGLCGKKERTQKEVAEAIGISQSYISRLEKKIIRKLRKKLEEADQPIVHTT